MARLRSPIDVNQIEPQRTCRFCSTPQIEIMGKPAPCGLRRLPRRTMREVALAVLVHPQERSAVKSVGRHGATTPEVSADLNDAWKTRDHSAAATNLGQRGASTNRCFVVARLYSYLANKNRSMVRCVQAMLGASISVA